MALLVATEISPRIEIGVFGVVNMDRHQREHRII